MRQARRQDRPGGAYEGLTRIGKRGVDWSGVVRLVPEKLGVPLRWRKPRRVFTNSMSDLFHESLPFDDIESVFRIMVLAERHTFQVLTKRPERMFAFCFTRSRKRNDTVPRNVWLGVSVEDQATADERIPLLLHTPAAVRFVSYEPALGPVDFRPFLKRGTGPADAAAVYGTMSTGGQCLDWVICGGESGRRARPFDVTWARRTIADCKASGVPVFVKQLGAHPVLGAEDFVEVGDGTFQDSKCGEPSEWPEDLRVREFPA
jgi:protein gp37